MSAARSSRWIPIVNAVGVVLGSSFAADTVNAVVSANLWAQAREERDWSDAPKVPVIPPLKHYLDPIVLRNVFANGAPDSDRFRRIDPCFSRPPDDPAGFESLAQDVRIVPYFEQGQPRGFKLFSVKPGSVLARIGFANGDVVRKVNGYDVLTPEAALQAYARVKNEKTFSIDVTRGGRNTTLSYAIR